MNCFIRVILLLLISISAYGQDPHLMLYFDINKTLIASDKKQNKTAEDTLNELLASQWHGCWDTSIQEPISYISYINQVVVPGSKSDPDLYKQRKAYYHHFVEDLREKNHPLYEEVASAYHQALEKLNQTQSDVFSSFYRLLDKLEEEQQSYTVILRSYGSEVFEIAEEINAFAQPLFHHFGILKEGKLSIGNQIEENLSEIYKELYSSKHIAIRDDYDYWERHQYQTPYSKSFLLDPNNDEILEIFFDDNILLDNQEINIVAPIDINTNQIMSIKDLAQRGQVVAVDTLEAIVNDQYFIERVQEALSNKNNKQQGWEALTSFRD